jgi:hypothetical protein
VIDNNTSLLSILVVNNENNTKHTPSLNDSTMTVNTQETKSTEMTEKHEQIKLTLHPAYTTPKREDTPEEKHPDHHDSDQWMAVSFLLIGSLATVFTFGILLYLRTTRR